MTTTLLRTSLLKRVLTRSSDFLLYSNPGRPRLGAHIRNCQVTSFDKLTVDSDNVNRLDKLEVGVSLPRTKSDLHQPVEKIYQRKSQVEHILLRPDSYIGSVQTVTEPMWVHDGANMVQREITFVPGLFKIFDEILVNAADNKPRDPIMDTIKVDINAETNTISVYNNGSGIPVVHHKEENMYVPTMIFGHLLTSSNFSDEDLKTTGGRNGFGAKLCNVFSSKFTLETADRNKSFKQTWTNNMSKVSEPIVKDSNKEFTKITFRPDLKKFNMKELDEDTVAMFSRRIRTFTGRQRTSQTSTWSRSLTGELKAL